MRADSDAVVGAGLRAAALLPPAPAGPGALQGGVLGPRAAVRHPAGRGAPVGAAVGHRERRRRVAVQQTLRPADRGQRPWSTSQVTTKQGQ